jgi:alpha-amylase
MQNGTMIQYFHWYTPANGSLWNEVNRNAKALSEMGINAVWLPPAYKGADGPNSHGYDVYDKYDLGEFDQKGAVRTRFGTKEEYLAAAKAIQEAGMQLYIDVVANHLIGADETEKVTVRKVDPENRNEFISEPYEIEAYTKFTFPGRKGQYSEFVWDHRCFTGIDYAADTQETGIFTIQNEYGEGWEEVVDDEKGNFDYLMGADIEFRNPEVREEFRRWGEWYYNTVKFDGFRLDAVKHITPHFFREWLEQMRAFTGREMFAVGEYWAPGQLELLLKYIDATEGKMSLFDSSLHHNLHHASKSGKDYDLSKILDDSLVSCKPFLAVTVAGNHDTQPLQALEAPLDDWFKPLAYALILLREHGYPCVFYADLYGAEYTDKDNEGNDCHILIAPVLGLDKLIRARDQYAYGVQRDYFDHANCIGWTREGDEEHEGSGCAVVMSNGEEGNKHMEIGKQHAGKKFRDITGSREEEIVVNEDGWAEFTCGAGAVAVWAIAQ